MGRGKIKVLSPAEIARSAWGIKVVGIAFMLGAVLLFIAFTWPRIRLAWGGVQANATVMDSFTTTSRERIEEYDHQERLRSRTVEVETHKLKVRFPLAGGGLAVAEVQADAPEDRKAVGETVPVIHLPDGPESAEIYSAGRFRMHLVVTFAFPFAFFAAGYVVMRL